MFRDTFNSGESPDDGFTPENKEQAIEWMQDQFRNDAEDKGVDIAICDFTDPFEDTGDYAYWIKKYHPKVAEYYEKFHNALHEALEAEGRLDEIMG